MNKQQALLIGNDINNINNSMSWKNLLGDIIKKCDVEDEVDIERATSKPFPLLYEEIFLRSLAKKSSSKEDLEKLGKELKISIAKQVKTIQHNSIHERIMKLDVKDIMTTNYEYSFYGCSDPNISETQKGSCHINESKYSIFRFNIVGEKRVWHIHGECDAPRSITLGYDQYAGFLQRMRNYVVTGTNYKTQTKNLSPFEKRINKGDIREHSWMDLFFTKDIHIFGLSLDTSEIDLWWLLTYRAKLFLQKKINIPQNEIFYYYPSIYREKSKEKLELFEATQVNTIAIDKEGKNYYNEIIDRISKRLKS